MSPRAAWRLEALGFKPVYDYVAGKADWLAHGLPREGTNAAVLYAGDLLDTDPPTCRLGDSLSALRTTLETARSGFLLVVNEERVVLGRVRRSVVVEDGEADATAESLMEPGPSTVRPSTPAHELAEHLAQRGLRAAVVTDPGGRLLGVFARAIEDLQ